MQRSWHSILITLAPAYRPAIAGMVAVLLLAVAAVTAVGASQPGNFAYQWKVTLERIPVTWQRNPGARSTAELRVAERRLTELEQHALRTQQVDAIALQAVLTGDEAAAAQAVELPLDERTQVAERLEAHVAAMTRLAANTADARAAYRLRSAAEQALALAQRVRAGQPAPEGPGSGNQPPWAEDEPPGRQHTPTREAPTPPDPMQGGQIESPDHQDSPAPIPGGARTTHTPGLPHRPTEAPPAETSTPTAPRHGPGNPTATAPGNRPPEPPHAPTSAGPEPTAQPTAIATPAATAGSAETALPTLTPTETLQPPVASATPERGPQPTSSPDRTPSGPGPTRAPDPTRGSGQRP